MTGLIGREIGGYRLLSLIGTGGMGEVYRAHDPKLGRDVAIKVLPSSVSADPDRLARFEREARLLAALNHPHIAAIYGTADADGVHGLVLELVEGETLTVHIARGLSASEALTLAAQIADALDLAHEKGIVHRDLKPENIKVTPDGVVKVLDFGIAKMSASDREAAVTYPPTATAGTLDGAIMGTAAFMSPEQARGKPVDKRADIWAFGCVLYEMLARRRAFPGDSMSDTLVSILERDPDWSALPAAVPPALRRLIQRCLQKDIRRRLRDIGDARAEIEDAASGGHGVPGPATEAASRWRLAPWILSVALGAAVVVLTLRDRAPASAAAGAPDLVRMVRLTNTPAREFGPAISPDGKWVAYYSDARGPTDIWIKYLDSGATLNLTASVDLHLPGRTNIGSLAISPDGRSLAFFASATATQAAYDTWVIPAPLGGPPRKLLQGMQGTRWSPDGRQLACILPGSSLGDALVLADADGSNQRQIVRAGGGRHLHWPMWSLDGKSIYFIYSFQPWNTEQSEIYRVPVSGGTPEPVVRSIRRAVYPVPLPGGDLIYSANPDSVDLGLWWQPASGASTHPLTNGIGEHAEAQLSADGRTLVSMVVERRESLVSIAPSTTGTTPALRALTDGSGGDLDPSYDPASDRIVFSSSRSGHRNLWTARHDGTDPRPLTSDTANDHHPMFSPDGRRIAFVSDRGGQWGIWLISAEGGAPRLLAPAVVLDAITWSRDGARIVYATPGRDVPTVLASVSVADGTIQPFRTPATAVAPSWSPTADVVAYLETTMDGSSVAGSVPVSRVELKFVDSQGRPLYTHLPYHRISNGLLAWAPDGRRLAVATAPANAPSALWIVEPDSKTPFRKVVDLQPSVRPRGVTWTRDGSSIILASQESVSDLVCTNSDDELVTHDSLKGMTMQAITRRHLLRSAARSTALLPFLPASVADLMAVAWQQKADPLAERRAQMGAAPIVTTKLTDNLTMLSGPGGNVVVLNGADGKLVVDTFVQPAWPKLKETLDGMGKTPIKTLIDTHWHFDHADNNENFRKAGAAVLAHANTKKRLAETHDLLGMHFPPVPPDALPTETFAETHKLQMNGEGIEAGHIPPAHTDTDVYIRFAKGNVLHLGDVFFNGAYPFIDATTGGSINGQIAGATLGLKLSDNATKIVPGHGPVGDTAALTRYRDMMVTVRDRVQKHKTAGRKLEEVVAAKPTADLDATWGKGFMQPDNFVTIVYNTLR